MPILNDRQIRFECQGTRPMIAPYEPKQVRVCSETGRKLISYGQSSFGYDIRCDGVFHIFKENSWPDYSDEGDNAVDPKNPASLERRFEVHEPGPGGWIVLPANGYVLTKSTEYFKMPLDVLGIALGKSTYARVGVSCNITPLEPGWEGILTIEIANLSPNPVRVYAGEGIAQVVFYRGEEPSVSYSDRGGKYQGQTGVTHAKV